MLHARHDAAARGFKVRLLVDALRQAPRRAGTAAGLWLGFAAELGWALFRFLALGLSAWPPVADRAPALAWLARAILLAVAAGFAAWLAAPTPPGRG